jgi:hypothetical protein
MYAAAGNPRRTPPSGKKTIYGWTLTCHLIEYLQRIFDVLGRDVVVGDGPDPALPGR